MKLLDIHQISVLLNTKKKTIYDWIHKRKIPYYKLEGSLRFKESEILQWLESKKSNPRKRMDI